MAQTTGAMSSKKMIVEYALDSPPSTFVVISGSATSVATSGGARMTGTAYTADGDTAVVVSGKREPVEVTVNFIYTEAAGTPNAWADLYTVYANGNGACVRWSVEDYSVSPEKRYTTASTAGTAAIVPISQFMYPNPDAASGDVVMGSMTLLTPNILVETKT